MSDRRERKKRIPAKIGDRFERLVVISEAEPGRNKAGQRLRRVWVRCDCGKEFIVSKPAGLRFGEWKSCGCWQRDNVRARSFKHGLTVGYRPKSIYMTWQGMLDRCYNPNSEHYNSYGGRGISVCDRWFNDAGAFAEDMGEKPSKNHSIDRIDVNGNYEPSNCRWLDKRGQSLNRRTNVLVTINGETHPLKIWCERLGANYGTARSRRDRGLPQDQWFEPARPRTEITREASRRRWQKVKQEELDRLMASE